MIRKLVHISDIHIHTTQYHDLYRKQFELLLDQLNDEFYGGGDNEDLHAFDFRIVITGDIFHQKINISNEQLMLASWFIDRLTDIGRVVIIPGNHDFLENNMERLDSITPVVELLNKDADVHYYKDSGVYQDENINWVVY